jgi:hypothetical protein
MHETKQLLNLLKELWQLWITLQKLGLKLQIFYLIARNMVLSRRCTE